MLAWFAILLCAGLSTLTDTTSTYFWEKQSTVLFLTVLILSPAVFFAFGYVGSRFGLSIASSLTNSLIVIGPILVGLFLRAEWKTIAPIQYIGMALIVVGITLVMLYQHR